MFVLVVFFFLLCSFIFYFPFSILSLQKVVVFSKSWCPFCIEANELLQSLGGDEVAVIQLDQRRDGSSIQSELASLTGRRTVPNVFIGGENVGGCDDVKALHRRGKLVKKLQQAGVDA